MFDRLGKVHYLSKADLKAGFHQIHIAPEAVEETTFKSKHGHFEFLVMPMGLRNGPALFQFLINHTFYDIIDDFLVVYLGDLLLLQLQGAAP